MIIILLRVIVNNLSQSVARIDGYAHFFVVYPISWVAIPKDAYKTILDVLIVTGIKYIEVCRLYENREWYNERRNIIHLPPEAQKKRKRTQQKRTIQPLPAMWNYTMNAFFNGKKTTR